MMRYHDEEWGVPLHDDRALFESIVLDGFQAGLSWRTVLHKREAFRSAFKGFAPQIVASFEERDVRRLLADPGIVRNRLKVLAAIGNARCFLQAAEEHGSSNNYIWKFTGHKTLRALPRSKSDATPTKSEESDAMSADLRRRGFKFVGTTICYAFMQAAGMVNDHATTCWRAPR